MKNRKTIKSDGNVVEADSAQDALNAAMENTKEALTAATPEAANELADIGFRWVKYGSGVGLLLPAWVRIQKYLIQMRVGLHSVQPIS